LNNSSQNPKGDKYDTWRASPRAPREKTVRKLFAMSLNRCAFPGCDVAMIDPQTMTMIGEVCHIKAASKGGPRYDLTQHNQERHGYDNLILMCSMHHKVIDSAETLSEFSPEHLQTLKRKHEQNAVTASSRDQALTDLALLTIAKIHRLDFKSPQYSTTPPCTRKYESDSPNFVAGANTEADEAGGLDQLSDLETGMESITNISTAVQAIAEELSRIVQNASVKTDAVSGNKSSTSAKLAIANQMAAQFQSPADRLQILTNELIQSVTKIEPGIVYIFGRMGGDVNDYAACQEFLVAFDVLTAAATMLATKLQLQIIMMLPLLKIAKSFKKPVLSMVSSFNALSAENQKISDWTVYAASLRQKNGLKSNN